MARNKTKSQMNKDKEFCDIWIEEKHTLSKNVFCDIYFVLLQSSVPCQSYDGQPTYSHATPQTLLIVTSYKNCSCVLWHTSQKNTVSLNPTTMEIS